MSAGESGAGGGAHTALPWAVEADSQFPDEATIVDALGRSVVIECDDAEDRAGLIVRAVNAHDELLAALRGVLTRYTELVKSGDCGFWNPEDEEAVKSARAALAKAGAQP